MAIGLPDVQFLSLRAIGIEEILTTKPPRSLCLDHLAAIFHESLPEIDAEP